MPLYDLNFFLRLSADLNYQLSAKKVEWHNVLNIILEQKMISDRDYEIMIQTCRYLSEVYAKKRRRLGSSAILHPLRVASLLSRSFPNPNLLDLLTAMLHDRFEDFLPKGQLPEHRQKIDERLQELLNELAPQEQWFLMERLQWLTKMPNETYNNYIGRLLSQSQCTPEVVRVKLADRLDNTLDMRIDMKDPFQDIDFFETVFQLIFLPNFPKMTIDLPHQSLASFYGSQQIYQLFKNITLMTLIRQKNAAREDKITIDLERALTRAGIKEAQRIILYLTAHFKENTPRLRRLIMETLEYVQSGGIDAATQPNQNHRLDGLLISRLDDPIKKSRGKKLLQLSADEEVMIEAALAFIVIFYSFLNNPNYYVRGINETGIHPEDIR